MRKLIVPLLLLFVASLGACKKDNPLPVQSQILGKWNLANVNYKYITNGVVIDESDTPGAPGAYMDFKSSTVIEISDGGANVGTEDWSFDEPTFSISISGSDPLKIVQIDAKNLVFAEVDGPEVTTYFLTR